MPVKLSPRANGVVIDSQTRRPIEGVAIYSRRHESGHYSQKGETSSDGTFSVAASWTVIPIPFAYFWPTRQLKFSHQGYRDYTVIVDENPPKRLERETVPPEDLEVVLEASSP
jgi:hypothetical protein